MKDARISRAHFFCSLYLCMKSGGFGGGNKQGGTPSFGSSTGGGGGFGGQG